MKSSLISPLRIALTTGDVDGIGSEVTAKALAKIKPQRGALFYLWRSPLCPVLHLNQIDRHFKRVTVSSWPEAMRVSSQTHKQIIDISSNLPPPAWVEISARASNFGHLDAMVTAPLSKTAIVAAGLKDLGHTGILQRVSKSKELFMGFIGNDFNVLLATGHIPFSDVSDKLTASRIERSLRAADQLRLFLNKKFNSKPLALLGLNPHCGEEGLIGDNEKKAHRLALESARKIGLKVEGPLVPDAAFFKENWRRYSVFVANYHDQGLIPFKMIHGQESGIQITMGLPFVRTSVDHGTAKDIFGKNKADAGSMRHAIEWAIKICQSSLRTNLGARL